MRNKLYLHALMSCLLKSLLAIKTVKGQDPKRLTTASLNDLTFEQLKAEVEHVKAQVVANDVSPVKPAVDKVALVDPREIEWLEFPYWKPLDEQDRNPGGPTVV